MKMIFLSEIDGASTTRQGNYLSNLRHFR